MNADCKEYCANYATLLFGEGLEAPAGVIRELLVALAERDATIGQVRAVVNDGMKALPVIEHQSGGVVDAARELMSEWCAAEQDMTPRRRALRDAIANHDTGGA